MDEATFRKHFDKELRELRDTRHRYLQAAVVFKHKGEMRKASDLFMAAMKVDEEIRRLS